MSSTSAPLSTLEDTPGYRKAVAWMQAGPKRLFIGGHWVDAVSRKTFETHDPSTEQLLARVAEGDAADIEHAVSAARAALNAPSWAGIAPQARAQYLFRIADAIEQNVEELAVIESFDNGMPLTLSRALAAKAAETFRYYAGWVTKIHGTTNPSDASRFIFMVREPMGVCALINAWNVPLGMAATKIAPALACGNTAILKPAEQAPLTALRLGELIQETGLPPGVLNVVPGYGVTAGAAMAAHGGIDKIAFTGSTVVGKQILQASAGNLKKVTLELGGKSPNIVFGDADLAAVVPSAVNGFCRNSGQICSSGTRLFVQESVHDEVVDQICKLAGSYKVGSPFDASTQLGPLISARQMDRVMSYVSAGVEEGAAIRLGGGRMGTVGHFVQPTVFVKASNSMRIAREEIFGPVLTVIPFKDEGDAVLQGNDNDYGLAAAVWTRDISRAHRVARALKSGRVWINTYAEADPVMSIGGYKQSGYGREYGAESIEAYTQTKSVLLRL